MPVIQLKKLSKRIFMAKISICITYYNQQDFVKQSLDSVLAIEFPCDYEILCGDDGSSDGTLDIIKEYALKYPDHIKYFVMDRDEKGKSINRASLNRLNLAKNATGDYIMFLDGDDYYCDKTFVKEAINIFKNNENTEVCAFNFAYLHTDNTKEVFNQKLTEGLIDSRKYISTGAYTHSGACVFKNILDNEKLELLNKINNFDDNAITIYFLQFGNLYYFNKSIYLYRQTVHSLWNSANSIERDLLNAFDYKLMCDSAPSLINEINKRQYSFIKSIYKHKHKLKYILDQHYTKYIDLAKRNNDKFILNLLAWPKLTWIDKLKTKLHWFILNFNKNFSCE